MYSQFQRDISNFVTFGQIEPDNDLAKQRATKLRSFEKKERVRAGHKPHPKKLCNTVDDILLTFEASLESELLSIKDYLVRKAAVVRQLYEANLDNIEDEEGIIEEIDTAEAFQNFVCKKVIEIE